MYIYEWVGREMHIDHGRDMYLRQLKRLIHFLELQAMDITIFAGMRVNIDKESTTDIASGLNLIETCLKMLVEPPFPPSFTVLFKKINQGLTTQIDSLTTLVEQQLTGLFLRQDVSQQSDICTSLTIPPCFASFPCILRYDVFHSWLSESGDLERSFCS
jgi:hypothetical protein